MKTLTLTLAALCLASCAAPPAAIEHRSVYVKPSMIMVTADQAAARGLNIAPAESATPPLPPDVQAADTQSVISPPDVKVYTVSRATDPADREMLHEQHIVYRRETTPAWRMHPPAGQKLLIGPQVSDGKGDLQPVLTKELVSFLAEQRRATEANQKAIAALFQAVERLNSETTQRGASEPNEAGDSPKPGAAPATPTGPTK